VTISSIYLRGMRIAPSQAADEIAIVNLFSLVQEYFGTGVGALRPDEARDALIRFLRRYPVLGHMSSDAGLLPFTVSWNGSEWRVGSFNGDPEVVVPIPKH
jgi:hypothetical protein